MSGLLISYWDFAWAWWWCDGKKNSESAKRWHFVDHRRIVSVMCHYVLKDTCSLWDNRTVSIFLFRALSTGHLRIWKSIKAFDALVTYEACDCRCYNPILLAGAMTLFCLQVLRPCSATCIRETVVQFFTKHPSPPGWYPFTQSIRISTLMTSTSSKWRWKDHSWILKTIRSPGWLQSSATVARQNTLCS